MQKSQSTRLEIAVARSSFPGGGGGGRGEDRSRASDQVFKRTGKIIALGEKIFI